MKTRTRLALGASVLVLAASALLASGVLPRPPARPDGRFLTQPVDTGTVDRTVHATGTLNPVSRVTVGSQASGTIARIHVDFNHRVVRGQLLAELDPATAMAQLRQAQAQYDSARATLALAQTNAQRTRYLADSGYVARSELDEAESNVLSAQASVRQQEAVLSKERSNLAQTRIRSPIDGVVVTRDVSLGQTVAASFQTPSLFTIAQNLVDMQIDTNVAEADVGLMREGQPVDFSVDAFPGERFQGRVHQIRNNYSVVQNVVTYNVVVRTANADGRLRPGMTAYVSIAVQRVDGVRRLPNAALRYRPAGASGGEPDGPAVVWRLREGRPEAVTIRAGLANAVYTELVDGELRDGDLLIVGERNDASAAPPPGMRLF